MSKLVEFKEINFSYKKELVLDNLTFHVNKNEKVAIIGANGAGKSTVLKLLSGLLIANNGSILFNGDILNKKHISSVRERIGFAFQDADAQLFMPSVYEDIVFFAKQKKINPEEIAIIASKALTSVGIGDLKDKAPYNLSGGEKRLASIAVAIANEPQLLILDEPSVGLDPKSRREVANVLKERRESLLITTHDMDLAYDICDRIIVLHKGKVLIEGSPSDVFDENDILTKANLEKPLQLQYKRED